MASEPAGFIRGVEDVRAALRGLPPKLRRGALRNALAAGARVFRDAARRATPVLRTTTYSGASAIKRGVRKPGTVRDAIVVRTSKVARQAGNVGVFVNVRPAKGASFRKVSGTAFLGLVKTTRRVVKRASARGAKSPNDPFYWRFLEFGTRKMRAFGFLQASARSKAGVALSRIEAVLGPAIQKLNRKGTS